MPYVDTLRDFVSQKEVEIARMEAELTAARAYIRFLQQRIEEAEDRCADVPDVDEPLLAIRRLILETGHPMFIDDIARGLDRPVSSDSREEIRRLVLPWVRRGEIFSRPRPSMYSLLELDERK